MLQIVNLGKPFEKPLKAPKNTGNPQLDYSPTESNLSISKLSIQLLNLGVFWVQGDQENSWRITSVVVGAKNPLLGGVRGGFPENFVSNATNHTVYPENPNLGG